MKGITISEMKVGDSASFTKTVSEHDVYTFAGLSGDFNPAHVNEVEAQKGMFGKRIAHGMLSAGFISTVLGRLIMSLRSGVGSRTPMTALHISRANSGSVPVKDSGEYSKR